MFTSFSQSHFFQYFEHLNFRSIIKTEVICLQSVLMIRELLKLSTKQYKQLASLRRKIERKVMPGSNIRQLNPENVSQWGISVDIAADALLKGHVLAIPTDTLYGLVTLAEHSDKLYRIKRRHAQKPFGVFVDRPEDIKQYCVQTVPDEFLKIIYPGPVTLLFERSDRIPSDFNPSSSIIGIRIPQARFARDLCRRMPLRLLAQTSANVSGCGRNPLRIQDFQEIWDDIDLIIDAGPIVENNGAEEGSTVIDLSVPGQFKMIRSGCAPIESMQLLREFGIRPAEEVEMERLTEAGKTLKILEIDLHEASNAEKEEEEEEKERHQSTGSNMM